MVTIKGNTVTIKGPLSGVIDTDDALVTEASALGLPPGRWPVAVRVNDQTYRISHQALGASGDLQYVEYTAAPFLAPLRIFND